MKKLIFLLLIMLVLGWSSAKVLAAEFWLPADQDESGNVLVSENINDNLFSFGNQIDVKADIDGNLFAFGNNINVSKDVKGSIFAGANSITISGNVDHDIFAGASNLTVDEKSQVMGNIYVGSGTVNILGAVKGSINSASGKLNINGTVEGNINSNDGKLTLAENAIVKGKITYSSQGEVVISQGAQYNELVKKTAAVAAKNNLLNSVYAKIFSLISLLFVGLLIIWLFPKKSEQLSETIKNSPLRSLFWGLLTLIVLPIFVIILMVLMVGAPLAMIILGFYFLAIYISKIFVAIALADFLFKGKKTTLFVMTIGVILFTLLTMIPYLGGLISFLSICIGLGAINLVSQSELKK